jgi:hypothetical protein
LPGANGVSGQKHTERKPEKEHQAVKTMIIRAPEELARDTRVHAVQKRMKIQVTIAKALPEYLRNEAR